MEKRIRILHVDDNLHDRLLVKNELQRENDKFEIVEADNREKFEQLITNPAFDLVLSDFNILGFDGLQVLKIVKDVNPKIPVIIVTGTGSEEIAIQAMKMGAADYVIKSVKHIRGLAPAIKTVLEYKKISDERERVLEDMRVSEEKFRIFFENSPVGKSMTGIDGSLKVNKSFCLILGYSREELESKNLTDITHPDDLSLTKEIIHSHLEGKMDQARFEKRYIHKNGSIVYAEVSTYLQRDNRNAPEFFITTINDITERRKAENERRESEQKYRTLVTQSPDGIYIIDLQGNFISVNQAMCEALHYNEEEFLSKTIWDIIPEEFASQHKERLKKIFSGEKINEPAEYQVKGKNEEIYYVEILSAPYIKDNKIVGIQGIARDITERKRVEKELIASKEKAEESSRLKSAFLTNMSHEIRTPMNAIMGFSDLMADAEGDEKNHFASIIHKSTGHLLKIIDDIVFISRLQSEKIPVNITGFKPGDLITNIYHLFNLPEKTKGISLTVIIPERFKDLIIQSDSDKLKQALINLVSNALTYTVRGKVEIGLEVRENFLEFYVVDSGIGIPEDEQEKIFETFYRGKEVIASAIGGTGLGLNIASELVGLLGGKIFLSSKPGTGSRFSFTIPFEKTDKVVSSEPQPRKIRAGRGYLNILIVEDEFDNYQYLEILMRAVDCRIDHALNGKEAVELTIKSKYDLILMDLKMPVMGGIEATQRIKQHCPDVPVIALTAYSFPEDRQNALNAGCDFYLSKPVSKNDLIQLIDNILLCRR